MNQKKAAIVLAAGKGKRMNSDLPKVLHEINGRPMIKMVLDTLAGFSFEKIVVVIGHKGEAVQKALTGYDVDFVWQHDQRGTGHAVMLCRQALGSFEGTTLVALGDVPFLSAGSLEQLFKAHQDSSSSATCFSALVEDATGYGRIVREGNSAILKEIVEHKDASEEVLKINEINSGTFCYDNRSLFEALDKISDKNSQGEYYLTDTIKIMHDNGLLVSVVTTDNPDELEGVNSVEQLERLAAKFSSRT